MNDNIRGEAQVLGNAQVLDNAQISGRVSVTGDAVIRDKAYVASLDGRKIVIADMAVVRGDSVITDGWVWVEGGAFIKDSYLSGDTNICVIDADIRNSKIFGEIQVIGDIKVVAATIRGCSMIEGNGISVLGGVLVDAKITQQGDIVQVKDGIHVWSKYRTTTNKVAVTTTWSSWQPQWGMPPQIEKAFSNFG